MKKSLKWMVWNKNQINEFENEVKLDKNKVIMIFTILILFWLITYWFGVVNAWHNNISYHVNGDLYPICRQNQDYSALINWHYNKVVQKNCNTHSNQAYHCSTRINNFEIWHINDVKMCTVNINPNSSLYGHFSANVSNYCWNHSNRSFGHCSHSSHGSHGSHGSHSNANRIAHSNNRYPPVPPDTDPIHWNSNIPKHANNWWEYWPW